MTCRVSAWGSPSSTLEGQQGRPLTGRPLLPSSTCLGEQRYPGQPLQPAPTLPHRQDQQRPGEQTNCSPRPQRLSRHTIHQPRGSKGPCTTPGATRGRREPPLKSTGPPGAPLLTGSGY
ncbi:hypothetical protein NDU88_001493 [Pleurodeles waltl]|uniref:Uncharacterized protein n=1 Tax=Pleurodeles waltl TaxID=8319 RepID=A0AAV7NEW9_PLEWA|nr:hypothetical protein NDU88_001493 [Pleurodeles waltl]